MKLLTIATAGLLALAAVPALPEEATTSSASTTSVTTNGVTVITESDGKTTKVYTVSPDGKRQDVAGLEKYRVMKDGNTSVYEMPDGTRLVITTDENGSRVDVRSEKRGESRVEGPRPLPGDPEARIRDLEERVRQLERERALAPRVMMPDLPDIPRLTPDAPRVFKWYSPDLKPFELGPEGRLFTPDTRREMRRAIEEAQRRLNDAMKQFQELTPEQKKEMQKGLRDAMPEIRKSLEEAMKGLQKSLKQLEQSEKTLKEI